MINLFFNLITHKYVILDNYYLKTMEIADRGKEFNNLKFYVFDFIYFILYLKTSARCTFPDHTAATCIRPIFSGTYVVVGKAKRLLWR